MTGRKLSDRIASHLAAEWERKYGPTPPPPPRVISDKRTHGRIATYNEGCRCDDCRRSAREYRALMRANAKARRP